MSYSPASPVFARNAVTQAALRAVLVRRGSPAVIEAGAIHQVLVDAGIDPAVFLGQFAAESSYGAAGYARTTHSPGNIVISRPALPHWTRAFGGRPWKAPNGRTYVLFLTWRDGTRAYAALMKGYRLRGWAATIATMASRWLGMADATRSGYVRNIVTHANLVPEFSPVDPETLARLRRYIATLEAVSEPTAEQREKLAGYRARLKEYLRRGA
jgi:hypothetical protein